MPKKKDSATNEVETRQATYANEPVDQGEIDLAVDTLRGDLRDAMLDRFKNTKRPWAAMTEKEQTEVANAFDSAARHLVTRATHRRRRSPDHRCNGR